MKKRVLRVRDGNLIPMGNNFAYVLGDHPNKTDDVDIGPNNKNGLSVNHGEIMQFNRNGVRVFSAEPILSGISPSQLVQAGINPNTVFAAQERYKDIHHLKDDGSHYLKGGTNTETTNKKIKSPIKKYLINYANKGRMFGYPHSFSQYISYFASPFTNYGNYKNNDGEYGGASYRRALFTKYYGLDGNTDFNPNTYLMKSKYTPSKNSNKQATYYTINNDDPYMRSLMFTEVAGTYKIDFGSDDNGNYVSIYDKWDLDPTGRYKNTMGGTPVELYDRFYEKEHPYLYKQYIDGYYNNKTSGKGSLKLGGDWTTKYNSNTPINNDYAVIPLQGNPLYDITGTTKYKSTSLDNPESRKFILDALWAMENPYGQGLNRDGTYSPYGDPNGSDQDVGPGILLSNLPVKNSYTKQELEDYAYNKVLEGRSKIRQSFDEKYGQGEYDKLDETRKYIMDDVRYRYGIVSQSKWPNLYQAIYDNDVVKALTNARTKFKNEKGEVIGWDNGRVERLAQYFYPDIVVEHKGNKDTYLKVYKKK